jgi:hypothetical protein
MEIEEQVERFSVQDASDYYSLNCTLPGEKSPQPVYGILDEHEGGYIAFSTSESKANQIRVALSRALGQWANLDKIYGRKKVQHG